MSRNCIECNVDISTRGSNAKRCIECHKEHYKEYHRKRYWANPEKSREWDRKRYWSDPEKHRTRDRIRYWSNRVRRSADIENIRAQDRERCKERYSAKAEMYRKRDRARYAANPSKVKERVRSYYAANSEKVNAKNKAWQKANPNHQRLYRHRRRARKLNQAGHVSPNIEQTLLVEQANRCNGCHRIFNVELKHTVDHIIPLSRGGIDEDTNLQLLCKSCNSSKLDRTFLEWRGNATLPPQQEMYFSPTYY